ncbi:unnamed protein product [Cylindrotheca closterium]|nr:unnamed protein product [Cylindrotheca closterium]
MQLLQPDVESMGEPNPFAMISSFVATSSGSNPDTLTLAEALQQLDREELNKELTDHIDCKHWKVVPLKSVSRGKRPIPMIWSMKRKRDPLSNFTKWKARLCAGSHRSVEFVDYWSTYSPVVSWSTVRVLIMMALGK